MRAHKRLRFAHLGPIVYCVKESLGTLPRPTSDDVKAATEPLYHPTRSTHNYVRSAMYQLPLLNEYPDSVSLKCSKCKEVHEHTYSIVKPLSDEPIDINDHKAVLEDLKLQKRLTCCSNCGHLNLIN